jgi:hypothetical protein
LAAGEIFMTCPHCGTQNIPDSSATCPQCGHALAAGPTPLERERIPAAPAPAAPNRRPYLLAGVLAAIVLVLAVALILNNRPEKAITQAPAATPPPAGPPVTSAPAPQPPLAGPPITQAPAAQPPTITPPRPDPMKAALEAYLQRVGQVEAQRQAVVTNLVPALIEAQILQSGLGETGMMKELLDPDPDAFAKAKDEAANAKPSEVGQLINGYVAQLRALDNQLRSIQPVPQPAFTFARSYDNAFAAYSGSMIQIGQMMSQGLQDPSKAATISGQLSSMKGPLQNQAQAGLRNADAQLTALCQQYGIKKPFDITDNPAGTVTGMGG